MAVTLKKLICKGPDKVDAEIVFSEANCLVRGPSDTGKSYIRECLWYLLGGEKLPKSVPQNAGYESLSLEMSTENDNYIITRGLRGGSAIIEKLNKVISPETPVRVEEDLNDLIVKLAGAAGKQTMRSVSKKGALTSGDLRHWFLLSQTNMISEDPISGPDSSANKTQRVGAFHVFLTGKDDSAIVLAQSKSEKDRIAGRIFAAEEGVRRANAGISPELGKADVVSALTRVNETLTAITLQYDERAALLKDNRQKITFSITTLKDSEASRIQSENMLQRFMLLDEKYQSDLDRLVAINEGTAYYQSLKVVPCPLCGSELKEHGESLNGNIKNPTKYRKAVLAEVEKIRALRMGLKSAIENETRRFFTFTAIADEARKELAKLEEIEKKAITSLKVEFSSDPKDLVIRHSELTSQLNLFEEIERLVVEIQNLKEIKRSKPTPILREALLAAAEVAAYVKELLIDWGFKNINTVRLDSESCDLYIDERSRLSYGAGIRALFLAALSISILKHSIKNGYPHFGFVVIDSPLKTYADPESTEQREVSVSTVREGFYSWLTHWKGPGQVIILENERVPENLIPLLKPIQFGGERSGFFPND